MNYSVVSVVVAYNSRVEKLSKLLNVLSRQCRVIVIDNSTNMSFRESVRKECFRYCVSYISIGDNIGISQAQNVGVAWARDNNASDILLMDDDSLPTSTLVSDLLRERAGYKDLIVISARTIDANGDDISMCHIDKRFELTPCAYLTSSGTLIPLSVFSRVGEFDPSLFIDCVDFEWGWRAIAMGFPLYLSNNVSIHHSLGEGTRFGFRIPSPIRHYYQYRNILRLIISSKAPALWRVTQLVKLPIKLLLIVFLFDRRLRRLYYALLGVAGFFLGHTGKIDASKVWD